MADKQAEQLAEKLVTRAQSSEIILSYLGPRAIFSRFLIAWAGGESNI